MGYLPIIIFISVGVWVAIEGVSFVPDRPAARPNKLALREQPSNLGGARSPVPLGLARPNPVLLKARAVKPNDKRRLAKKRSALATPAGPEPFQYRKRNLLSTSNLKKPESDDNNKAGSSDNGKKNKRSKSKLKRKIKKISKRRPRQADYTPVSATASSLNAATTVGDKRNREVNWLSAQNNKKSHATNKEKSNVSLLPEISVDESKDKSEDEADLLPKGKEAVDSTTNSTETRKCMLGLATGMAIAHQYKCKKGRHRGGGMGIMPGVGGAMAGVGGLAATGAAAGKAGITAAKVGIKAAKLTKTGLVVLHKKRKQRKQKKNKGRGRPSKSRPDVSAKATSDVIKTVQENVAAIKQPIVQTVASVGDAQCANVKKLFGVCYTQITDEAEPDLTKLQLHVRSHLSNKIYNIDEASFHVPRDLGHDKKMIIFIHGFTDDPTKASFQNISESFLDTLQGSNVIALDGSSLIRWLYLRSTTYVRFMGQKLGEVLAEMVKAGQDPKDIIIVGHSLGAHVAGFTGKTFRRLTGGPLGRISALDPAGPCFSSVDKDLRLHKRDAHFVDVMHTDAGVYGITETIGHADFFVNGGSMQPNCLFETCSHSRSWLYYSESIKNPEAFLARKCKDWRTFENNDCGNTTITYMGYPTPPNMMGRFYLQTADEPPYGLGWRGLMHDGSKPAAKKVIDAGSDLVLGVRNVATKLLTG